MKILPFFWAAILILLPISGGLCAALDDTYEMPLAEAEDVVSSWLEANGFQLYRPPASPGTTILIAEKGRRQLRITARRSSPLAARIRIEPIGGKAHASGIQLQQHLQGYLQLPTGSPSPASSSLPNVVRGYMDAVVCIYADGQGREVQLTGFAVDIEGIVVCTGHDLQLGQVVSLVLHDGRQMAGTVIKLDQQRDLALIQAERLFETVISLRNGRFMINDGDPLFSITCTNGGLATIQNGYLDGPARRVAEMPLWQVRMAIAAGSSGSPVFDEGGRLAAIVKGRFRGTETIGFLIPFETLLHFLGRY